MDELLPCPFCGSADIDPEGWGTTGGISGPCCNQCLASVGSALKPTEENIALWNIRPAIQNAAPAMLEGLRGIRANLVRLAWEENSLMIEGIDALISQASPTPKGRMDE